jgi:glyoxylase-like metal-dependent hydrolase (beta-lactamase superfamily II)
MGVMQKLEAKVETRTRSRPDMVASDLAYLRVGVVNLFLYGRPGTPSGSWVLIDAGLPGSASRIVRAAAEWIGPWARPSAIVLTHGHFDHVGALRTLADRWDVPVYAHPLEFPYLTGRSAYPPPDPTVGGGAIAALSRFYPRGPIDISHRIRTLPDDGSIPGMPGWRWIHTPGHTPGHVSLFRDEDRTLIAGDAFVTTKPASATAVLTQRPELHGPPAYFTQDWEAARQSVETLAGLEPLRVATGHGPPLQGPGMLADLHELARNFDSLAVPRRPRHVEASPVPRLMIGLGAALLLAAWLKGSGRRRQ